MAGARGRATLRRAPPSAAAATALSTSSSTVSPAPNTHRRWHQHAPQRLQISSISLSPPSPSQVGTTAQYYVQLHGFRRRTRKEFLSSAPLERPGVLTAACEDLRGLLEVPLPPACARCAACARWDPPLRPRAELCAPHAQAAAPATAAPAKASAGVKHVAKVLPLRAAELYFKIYTTPRGELTFV